VHLKFEIVVQIITYHVERGGGGDRRSHKETCN